jgi:hypothetical protein
MGATMKIRALIAVISSCVSLVVLGASFDPPGRNSG